MSALLQRLSDAARSGVFRVGDGRAVTAALRGAELDCVSIALPAGKEAMLGRIAQVLAFPAWFGGNWDALEDCLGDLSWRNAEGTVLVFEQFTPGDELGTLVDILRASAEGWALRGQPFYALFVDPQQRLGLPELDA